jgi:hypothetical protein
MGRKNVYTNMTTTMLADASRWADVAAVPLFALATWYFARIPWRRRSLVEWALLLFALAGMLLDSLFSLDWWVRTNNSSREKYEDERRSKAGRLEDDAGGREERRRQ